MALACVYSSVSAVKNYEYAFNALILAIGVLALILLPFSLISKKRKPLAPEQDEAIYFREKAKAEVNSLYPSYEHLLEPSDFDIDSLKTEDDGE